MLVTFIRCMSPHYIDKIYLNRGGNSFLKAVTAPFQACFVLLYSSRTYIITAVPLHVTISMEPLFPTVS